MAHETEEPRSPGLWRGPFSPSYNAGGGGSQRGIALPVSCCSSGLPSDLLCPMTKVSWDRGLRAGVGWPPLYTKDSQVSWARATWGDGTRGLPVLTGRPGRRTGGSRIRQSPTLAEASASHVLLHGASPHRPLGPVGQPHLLCCGKLLSESQLPSQAPGASSPRAAPAPPRADAPPAASAPTPEACCCSPPPWG